MGRRRRSAKNIRCQVRLFQCDTCGTKREATKYKGKTVSGHKKVMYCLVCQARTEHTQIE